MKNKSDLSNIRKYLLGGFGAFVGAMAGTVIWIILYRFGIIAGFAGAAIAFLSFEGYKLLTKEHDVYGYILSFIISILFVFLVNYFTWSLYYYEILKEFDNVTFFDVFGKFDNILKNTECYDYYIRDMIIGIVSAFLYTGIKFCISRRKSD